MYNSVGTSRFFIDTIQWLRSVGIFQGVDEGNLVSGNGQSIIGLTNNEITTWDLEAEGVYNKRVIPLDLGITLDKILQSPNQYLAVLGHNCNDIVGFIIDEGAAGAYNRFSVHEGVVNFSIINDGSVDSSDGATAYNGFSIARLGNPSDTLEQQVRLSVYGGTGDYKIRTISLGDIFEMPHSADLSLTLGYETGTKTIETRGGASLSNTMWRPPMWGELGAWELSDPDSPTTGQKLAHSSRRTWNLSFSFLDKTDSFPKYNALNRYTNENISENELPLTEGETLLTSNDFFSVVWEKVGTALPFIFQPDKDVAEFAICKFTNNISFQQIAPALYSCKISLKEVW